MRPPLPYGQFEGAFSGFGERKFCFRLYVHVRVRNFAVDRKNRPPAVR